MSGGYKFNAYKLNITDYTLYIDEIHPVRCSIQIHFADGHVLLTIQAEELLKWHGLIHFILYVYVRISKRTIQNERMMMIKCFSVLSFHIASYKVTIICNWMRKKTFVRRWPCVWVTIKIAFWSNRTITQQKHAPYVLYMR